MKIFAGIVVHVGLLLVVVFAASCRFPLAEQQNAATPKKDDTPRKLLADVRLTAKGVSVKNTDVADFPSVTLKLNMTQFGGNDGEAGGWPIAKGKEMTIPYSEFTVGTTRFDLRKTKILTIYLKGGDGSAKLFLCPGTTCVPA